MTKVALLSLLLSLGASAQAQPDVRQPSVTLFIYPNSGIFELDGDQIAGPGAAMLNRLQSGSGVRLDKVLMPVPRALQTVERQPGSCVIALPRTPDLEARLRWAGPWSSGVYSVYGRASENRPITGPDELRGAQTAVLRNSTTAAWLREQGLSGYEVTDISTGLRMLQAGRVDFWLGHDIPTRFVIKHLGGTPPRVMFSYGRVDLYIACHPGTAASTVKRLHDGIDALRRSGELAEFGLP